jgi:hypothetical protein
MFSVGSGFPVLLKLYRRWMKLLQWALPNVWAPV